MGSKRFLTEIVQSSNPLDEEWLTKAVALLERGELVSFPTETVYGLGANFFDLSAQNKIYEVKGRPRDNPLIIHIHSILQAEELADLPKEFYLLAEAFWPGPLTMIVPKASSIDVKLTANLSTVALRIPENKTALAILKAFKRPLVAPSANISGKPSPTSAFDVFEDLEGKIELIVDGGETRIGIESTVLNLSNGCEILRPGAISEDMIERVLNRKLSSSTTKECLSPGMKYRHYAPKAKIHLLTTASLVEEKLSQGERVLVYHEKNLAGTVSFDETNLYSEFRKADRDGLSMIYLYLSGKLEENKALMNRILKASEAFPIEI